MELADLLARLRAPLAEVDATLESLGDLPLDQQTLEIVTPVTPITQSQARLQEAVRVLAYEVEMKPRIEAVKVARSA
jgi:hypothetical protein